MAGTLKIQNEKDRASAELCIESLIPSNEKLSRVHDVEHDTNKIRQSGPPFTSPANSLDRLFFLL